MFPWARRLEVSFECIGCHFCSAVMTFQGSSGPQKRGIMLLSKVIFSNNQIIVLLVVGSGLRQTPALQNIYCFSFVFISLLKMMLDEPFFFFFPFNNNNNAETESVSFACIERKRTAAVTIKNNLYIV